MLTVGSLAALALLLWVLKGCLSVLKFYRIKWKVEALGFPQVKGLPLVGNLFQVLKLFNLAPGVPYNVYVAETIKGYGEMYKGESVILGAIGPEHFLILLNADSVEVIFGDSKQVNKSWEYNFVQKYLGTGLVTSSYSKWKVHRKLLTPAFHFRILDQFQPIIAQQAEILVQKLRPHVNQPFVHIEKYITKCTLDVIAETAMGVRLNAQKNEDSPIVKAMESLSSLIFKRIISPWVWSDFLYLLTPDGRKFNENMKITDKFVKKVIAEKTKELDEKEVESVDDEEGLYKTKVPFLERLLLYRKVNKDYDLSDRDIEEEVHTFTFAGHDTTTNAIAWTSFMLGLYPELQDKVYEEIQTVFGKDKARPVTIEDLRDLRYMECFIKETLRLYPPVPILFRELSSEHILNGVTLPIGTTVGVVLPILHRDTKYFPNPEVFDPDRFLTSNRHPYAYIPFSAGPRNCIGQRFAMLEIKTILCALLRNFKLTSLDTRDQVLISTELVSRPHKHIRIKLDERF